MGSNLPVRDWLFAAVLAFFTIYTTTLIHLEALGVGKLLEEQAPLLFAGVGRAPDQYRVLGLWVGELFVRVFGLHNGAFVFQWLSLTLALALFRQAGNRCDGFDYRAAALVMALVFPLSMFNGWRPETPLLLLLTMLHVFGLMNGWGPARRVAMVTILSLARADLGLLYGLASLRGTDRRAWPLLVGIPVVTQLVLSKLVFPEATYYCEPIMLRDNLSLEFLRRSPLTYLVLAALLVYGARLAAGARRLWRVRPDILAALAFYVALLVVVARLDEYRLFLHLLPLVFYGYWSVRRAEGAAR